MICKRSILHVTTILVTS